jgi:hypothetical protein
MPSDMQLETYFQDSDETSRAKRLFQKFHDKIYLNDSVSNDNALLLSMYMACNAEKASEIVPQRSQELFALMGRSKEQHHAYVRRCDINGTIEKVHT